jgi:membrane protein
VTFVAATTSPEPPVGLPGSSTTGTAAAGGRDSAVNSPAAARRKARELLPPRHAPLRLAARTLSKAWQDRVLGLSAEAAFWQLLSLVPLMLALLGLLGYFSGAIGSGGIDHIEHSLLRASSRVLTQHTVDETVQPTLEKVLRQGRADIVSVGFIIALWSGSSSMATFVNTITIAYGQRDQRSAVRSRLLALGLYLAAITVILVLLPALVLGPGVLDRLLHGDARILIHVAYWPVVALISLTGLSTLYHLAVPIRPPWPRAIPGAILAVVFWLTGSFLLRLYLGTIAGHTLAYGSLGAPVAILLFFYITALAVLLGAELNASIDAMRREGVLR